MLSQPNVWPTVTRSSPTTRAFKRSIPRASESSGVFGIRKRWGFPAFNRSLPIVPPLPSLFGYLSSWQLALLRGLGVRTDGTPPDARAEWLWTNLPTSWGVFVVLALLAAGLYAIAALYRREIASCPIWMKTLLATLRSGVMLLLAVIFLNPAIVYVQSRSIQSTIVIARDASRSMSTTDTYATSRLTRAAVVNELLSTTNSEFLAAIER